MNIYEIENQLLSGNISLVEDNAGLLKEISARLLNEKDINPKDLKVLVDIYNIIYTNSPREDILIDDGMYDMMVAKLNSYGYPNPPGAPLIDFKDTTEELKKDTKVCPVRFFDKEERDKKLEFYKDELGVYPENRMFFNNYCPSPRDIGKAPTIFTNEISKRTHSTPHENPDLVGTLDKCKFVLVEDALRLGVDIEDPKNKVFERDFFGKHIQQGIISPDEELEIMIELKYDGTSIEGSCSNIIESARSRGDTGIGMASDMTDILKGYPFPKSVFYNKINSIKFEAIMCHADLHNYNISRNKSYANCRSAINGLFGFGGASRYRDYITLVPLDMDPHDIPQEFLDEFPNSKRIASAAFLNAYYATKGIPLICTIERGNYRRLLFMIKKFLEEADYARQYMPFMYDGIVIEYTSDKIRERLGRKNYINQYAMAVKFDPLKKQTIAREYKYTVGKDGSITPMIYYDPVEFYGTIHPKSSAQSYAHFMELGIKPGDIIDVTYTNDVMPYVTRPTNDHNDSNSNFPFEFIKTCPICGAPITISESGKSAYCSNKECNGIRVAIATDMLNKLGFEGFAEESVKLMGVYTFKGIMIREPEDLNLGEADTASFAIQKQMLIERPIPGNIFLGALGFTGISNEKWKYVCQVYDIQEICNICEQRNTAMFTSIKGIGPKTAETIINEYIFFRDDIYYGLAVLNIKNIKGTTSGKSIRFTGFRNKQLIEQLNSAGYDAKEGSVSKTTDILLVPTEGHQSTKVDAALKNGHTKVIPVDVFIDNMDRLLQE